MKSINNILVCVHDRDDGEITLDKAWQVASACNANITLLKVAYEGFADLDVHEIDESHALKTFVLQAEESLLAELAETLPPERIESAVIWHRHSHEAILKAAADCDADLIIKSTDPLSGHRYRTPQDWHLLRQATIAVMLVKPEPWRSSPDVVVAVDIKDDNHGGLNDAIINTGAALGQWLGGDLHLVSAFPSVEHWVGPVTVTINFDRVRERTRAEFEHRLAELAAEHQLAAATHAEEGEAHQAIRHLVERSGAQILVLGTAARSGVRGVVLGNTSELILHQVFCDVLVTKE